MRAQEVIVSAPEGYAVAGTFFRTVAAGDAAGFFKSAVQTFDKLFERTEFFGNLIIIGQADHLGVILSRLVDTFISRISLTMPPAPKSHNTACVLPREEPFHWQSRSSGYSSS